MSIRLSDPERETIGEAAAREALDVGPFVRRAAVKEAERVLSANRPA